MLPESKGEFPKCVYLDQNMWVELEAVKNGDNKNRALIDTLTAVENAAASGEFIFPLSSIHVAETQAWGNRVRRERLAEFMVRISGNNFVKAYPLLLELELRSAVYKELIKRGVDITTPCEPVRPLIINKGIRFAADADLTGSIPKRLKGLLEPVIDSKELTLFYLIDVESKKRTEAEHRRAEDGARDIDRIRANAARDLSEEMRWRYEVYSFFTQWGLTKSVVPETLDQYQIDYGDFLRGFKARSDFVEFLKNVPSAYATISLLLEHGKNESRTTKPSDINDTGFLPVAIPYFNAVVTDKYWTHITKARGLDREFGVCVTSDLAALKEILNEMSDI